MINLKKYFFFSHIKLFHIYSFLRKFKEISDTFYHSCFVNLYFDLLIEHKKIMKMTNKMIFFVFLIKHIRMLLLLVKHDKVKMDIIRCYLLPNSTELEL